MRIEYPGAVYHITSRGNNKSRIFYADDDRTRFLDVLANVIKKYNWICHSYCLMSNHYHLLIETQEANLSQGMRQLNSVYTMRVNKKHNKVGHLFQGRFKGVIVDRKKYLLELCRYIVLNPIRAKMVARPEDYYWSSHRATINDNQRPKFLTTEWVLSQFGKRYDTARKKYIDFVYAGINCANPWNDLRGQIILGKDEFLKTLEELIGEQIDIPEIPMAQRKVLQELYIAPVSLSKDLKNRNDLIFEMHYKKGMAIGKIARVFSLHPSTVSKVISRCQNSQFKT